MRDIWFFLGGLLHVALGYILIQLPFVSSFGTKETSIIVVMIVYLVFYSLTEYRAGELRWKYMIENIILFIVGIVLSSLISWNSVGEQWWMFSKEGVSPLEVFLSNWSAILLILLVSGVYTFYKKKEEGRFKEKVEA